jgi:hypothetical protein
LFGAIKYVITDDLASHGEVTIVFYDIRDACRAKRELMQDPLPCTSFDMEFVRETRMTNSPARVDSALLLRLPRFSDKSDAKVDLDEILRLLGSPSVVKTFYIGDRCWKYVDYYDSRDAEQAFRGLTDVTLQVSKRFDEQRMATKRHVRGLCGDEDLDARIHRTFEFFRFPFLPIELDSHTWSMSPIIENKNIPYSRDLLNKKWNMKMRIQENLFHY